MIDQRLINYIREQVKAGYDINRIKNHIIANGYNKTDVDSCINEIYHPEIKHVHSISKNTIIGVFVVGLIIASAVPIINFYLSKPTVPLYLLDIKTSAVSDKIKQGEDIDFIIELSNFGTDERFDVYLKHEIMGTEIYIEETIAVETSASKKSEINIPDDIIIKNYVLKTTATYGDKMAFSTFGFNVESKDCIPNWECSFYQPEICPENETQTRTCTDLNNCKTEENMPDTAKTCSYKIIPEEPKEQLSPSNEIPELSIWEKIDLIKEKARINPEDAEEECKSIEIESQMNKCYSNIAEGILSTEFCKKITNIRKKDKCITNIAKIKQESIICTEIDDVIRRDECYMVFVNNKDYSVCDKMKTLTPKKACIALRDSPGIVVK